MTLQHNWAAPKRAAYTHAFVNTLPEVLEEGILYISMRYATVAHKCFCGCGREVVTPLHPTKWRLLFDGKTVSLHPSVGSWSLPCRSHYWLRGGQIAWAAKWSRQEVAECRERDSALMDTYFRAETKPVRAMPESRLGKLAKLFKRLRG